MYAYQAVAMIMAVILLTGDLGVDAGVWTGHMCCLEILHISCNLLVSGVSTVVVGMSSHFACFGGFGFAPSSSLSLFVTSPDFTF